MSDSTNLLDRDNLDPQPWVVSYNGVDAHPSATYKPRFENGFGEVVQRRFAPRSGFSQNREDYADD